MGKIPDWLKVTASSVGGWWSLMSGALSIPFAFIALFSNGKPQIAFFAILAYCALWVMVFRMAMKIHKLESPPSLSDAAMKLLLAAAKGSDIVYVEGFGGASINVGGNEFIKPFGDARLRAVYTSALDELEKAGCIVASGMFRRLTAKGYSIADSKLGRK
jgi:hypothetical protein